MEIVKYIVLGNWTDQGGKTIDEVPKRVETIKNLIKEQNRSINI